MNDAIYLNIDLRTDKKVAIIATSDLSTHPLTSHHPEYWHIEAFRQHFATVQDNPDGFALLFNAVEYYLERLETGLLHEILQVVNMERDTGRGAMATALRGKRIDHTAITPEMESEWHFNVNNARTNLQGAEFQVKLISSLIKANKMYYKHRKRFVECDGQKQVLEKCRYRSRKEALHTYRAKARALVQSFQVFLERAEYQIDAVSSASSRGFYII